MCPYCQRCSLTRFDLEMGFFGLEEIRQCLENQRDNILSMIEDEEYDQLRDTINRLHEVWGRFMQVPQLQGVMKHLGSIAIRGVSQQPRERFVVLPSDLRHKQVA